MTTFDDELDSLDAAFKKDEEEHATKRRFEQSELWQEHRKWHTEQGTQAHLVVWDDERPAPVQPAAVELQEQPKVQHIKVGGCECQPRLPFMQLEEKGDVVPGVPQPIEEAKTYANGGTSTAPYGGQGAPGQVYNAPSGPSIYRQQ